MSEAPIYVTQPIMPPLDEFIPYLHSIWENKILSNSGAFHVQLEAALCEYLGVSHLVLFNNGTVALICALLALGLSGEVITTPYSFVATTHSLIWNNLTPVFVDIEPDSFNLDPKKIEAALTDKTSAILAVHCYGHPCAVEEIQTIADKHQLKVIYDAAHAFGVQTHQDSLLNYGDLSVLSFHATKVFNTFEGGAIICHDERMKNKLNSLKNFGITDEVSVSDLGLNGKMNEVSAAFGLLQLCHLEQALAQRKQRDAYYREHLMNVPGISMMDAKNQKTSNYAYFPIIVNENYPVARDELYERLKRNNIHARRYFYPLISDFAPYKHFASSRKENLIIAAQMAQQVLCLPFYPDLDMAVQERIINLIRDY